MKARVAGAELAYDVRGRGPVVLFFHAFPLGMFQWDAEAALLEGSHCVVRFDARGFGASPPGDGPLTMERIADDGVALLDHLGLGQAVAVGCSMGGYALFALVRRHPGRLRGLVLQDTRASADSAEARANRSVLAEKVLEEGAAAAADAFLPRLLGDTSHRSRPELVARLRSRILETPARGIADALLGLGARADSRPTLREIRVPTLITCGVEDAITPPGDSEEMARGIAGAHLVVVPEAGHLANLENPASFGRELHAFLSGIA